MKQIINLAAMRDAERAAMEGGVSEYELMERAAGHVAQTALAMCDEALFLCGTGNNGGDGLAAARLYAALGGSARVALVGDKGRMGPSSQINAGRLADYQIPLERDYRGIRPKLIVDALFGTGLTRAPEGEEKAAIEWINASGARVLAVDIPSGVDARDGSTPGVVVRADQTIAFHAMKPGHVFFPGRGLCGDVRVCGIGLKDGSDGSLEVLEREDIPRLLPPRRQDAHKGDFGRALLVAGSRGMAGAAALCARGALHAGAGLVTLAVTRDVLPVVQTLAPEATALLLPEEDGAVSPECAGALDEAIAGKDALAIGPGMTACSGTRAALLTCLASGVPLVVDADGLNVLTARDLAGRRGEVILTPHPGEMARLLGRPLGHPLEEARSFARETGAVLLLKGASTVIAEPGGRATVNLTGTPSMARGGSGDVLTGVIAALLAQGLSAYDAARLGAHLHGLAGEEAHRRHGLAMTAMDLPKCLMSNA